MITHHIGPIASAIVPNILSIVTPVNLTIENPGAENSNTGWTFVNGFTTGTTQTNGTPRTGNRIFYNGSAGTNSATMAQTISIPASAYFGVDNNAYNLVFNRYANCQATGTSSTWMQFDFLDASGYLIERVRTPPKTATQNVWTLQTETVLVPPNTRSIQFTIISHNPNGTRSSQKVYIDDLDSSLVRVDDLLKIDYSTQALIMGSRADAIAVRQANLYAVLGSPTDRLAVRDAQVYFIITP